MNNRVYLSDAELLMGRMAALIEASYDQSEDFWRDISVSLI